VARRDDEYRRGRQGHWRSPRQSRSCQDDGLRPSTEDELHVCAFGGIAMRHSSRVTVNRSWWNERAAVHGQDDVYDTRGFLAGRSTLYRLDLDVTGDVTGRDLIHLQCHTGMDTLSWVRAGAGSVTGIDFSDIAVAKAAATAEAAGLADRATFIEADVLTVPDWLHARFDVCYASRGVVCWIGDMDAWMRTAASALRPGGRPNPYRYRPSRGRSGHRPRCGQVAGQALPPTRTRPRALRNVGLGQLRDWSITRADPGLCALLT
jgi:hypothetical protein